MLEFIGSLISGLIGGVVLIIVLLWCYAAYDCIKEKERKLKRREEIMLNEKTNM